MKAFDIVKWRQPWSTEKHGPASMREIKQWFKDGIVVINNFSERNYDIDITGKVEITLFPKNSKRKNSLPAITVL